jgi:hypothetical protein
VIRGAGVAIVAVFVGVAAPEDRGGLTPIDRIAGVSGADIAVFTVFPFRKAQVHIRVAGSNRAGVGEAGAVAIIAAHHASATAADQAKSA